MERQHVELWVRATMGARRMRTTVAGHAWSEGASEDEGARGMAMMAEQDWCCHKIVGRTNHRARFPFELFPFVARGLTYEHGLAGSHGQ
jgi:hypothetical protein